LLAFDIVSICLLILFGFFRFFALCDGYRKHRVLLVSAALHVNWVALADIHFMLPGGHGHQRFDYLSMGNGLGRERFGLASWIVRHCP
jgi:hypothetical protein